MRTNTSVTTAKMMATEATNRRRITSALHAVSIDQLILRYAPGPEQRRPRVGTNLDVVDALVHRGDVLERVQENARSVRVDRGDRRAPEAARLVLRRRRDRAVDLSLELRAVVAAEVGAAESRAGPRLRDPRAGRGVVAARQDRRVVIPRLQPLRDHAELELV